jgi:TetR/AcrR family transcriptional repressor of nem operon
MLQTRGFNGFSFRDLAQAVGVKSASVHHHFPTKEDLGVAMVRGYRQELSDFFDALAARPRATPRAQLQAFADLFDATASEGDRLCLAGMLASDFATLGPALQQEVRGFFRLAEGWLAGRIAQMPPRRTPAQCRGLAALVMSTLEGALLTGRALGEPDRVRRAAARQICVLEGDGRGG